VAVGDFNGDGDPDLAVANNDDSGTVSVLTGGAGGGFGAQTTFATGSHPESVAVGDFNADGDPDLAVANRDSGNVSVRLNTATARVEADAPGLTFATQPRGTLSSAQTLRVFSSGDRALGVHDVSIGGAAGHEFIVVGDTCSGRPVPAQTSCAITVRFAPEQQGPRRSTLSFRTNDPGNPTFAIVLSGIGGDLPAGPPGPIGTSGPAGATGPIGASGPAGATGPAVTVREALVTAFTADRYRATRGRRLRLRYLTTVAAQITIELRRGRRVLTRTRQAAARGPNNIVVRTPRHRGRYSLKLTAITATQRATDQTRLTII
jgi:hypothetical protein